MAFYEHAKTQLASDRILAASLSLLCAFTLVISLALQPSQALAEDIDTNPQADDLQQRIEQTATELEEANSQLAALEEQIASTQARITELQALIPEQQIRSDAAACELYKFQQDTPGLLELLLNSDSFYGFLINLEYMNRISETNIAEITRLQAMKSELESSSAQLEKDKADAVVRAEQASTALAEAQEARMEAQRQAQAAAKQQATSLAESGSNGGDTQSQTSSNGSEDDPESGDAEEASPAPVEAVEDGADWADEETVFVNEWAPRINAYLSGSPLSGQGETFARAAWRYGVDPRWSPAISCTESSKGRYCFLPHNAWGWGSVSWDSWEEAINDHVRGLARGYGYTISVAAAKKYCPPNWEHWYNTTLSQMNKI